MFFVHEISDVLRVEPRFFSTNGYDTLSALAENKLCNKVIKGAGLGICMYQVDEIHYPENIPGEGSVYTKVDFRFVVFRPFKSEIIIGTVKYCTKNFVKVHLDFFDDIVIYSDQLPHPTEYIEEERMFKWQYSEEEGKDNSKGFYISVGQEIRIRVLDVFFDHDLVVIVDKEKENDDDNLETDPIMKEKLFTKRKPMLVLASIAEMGLGPTEWWRQE